LSVTLTDPVSQLARRLGEGESVPVVGGTNLARLRFASLGIDILASDQVLAIWMLNENSPPLALKSLGPGSKFGALRIGMTSSDLDRALKDEDYDFRQLTDPHVNYRFYRGLGLAARVVQAKVTELIVVQIPEGRSPLGS